MPFLKLSGMLLIFLCSAAAGFLKANELSAREKKLDFLCRGFSTLKERIRSRQGEIERLVTQSFGTELVKFNEEGIHLNKNGLTDADLKLFYEYFSEAGMSDIQGELERCSLYLSLFKQQLTAASQKKASLSKLYKSLGVLTGAFICIFFL